MAALRKEALKTFCCSICNKKYRYEPPFLKHMAKHALEDGQPTSASITDLSSQLVAYQLETSSKFESLMTVIAELQVALAAETEMELLIKSRGLREGGIDWKHMFTLPRLEAGMVTYFTSCKPHIAYDTTATRHLVDVLPDVAVLLELSNQPRGTGP